MKTRSPENALLMPDDMRDPGRISAAIPVDPAAGCADDWAEGPHRPGRLCFVPHAESLTMRTTPTLCLALALAAVSGCANTHGTLNEGETSLLVANLTQQPITVTYMQSPENAEGNTVKVEQLVLPDYSIRFSGKRGDRVTVQAGEEPPMTLEYARKSHVLSVSDEGGRVSYDLRRGYSDPTKD
jgi:hypothetical protein